MNLRKNLVLIALGALVAAAAALVYAQSEAAAGEAAAREQTSKVLYDFNALPDPVKRMLQQIAAAAQSGEIETMRPVFESNELKPMVATEYVDDPVAFWKKASADGTGRAGRLSRGVGAPPPSGSGTSEAVYGPNPNFASTGDADRDRHALEIHGQSRRLRFAPTR